MVERAPAAYAGDALLGQIRAEIARSQHKVVVLDDDPTGPQAMSDVYVVTEWSVEALKRELLEPRPLFLVLTNTRARTPAEAVALHRELVQNLQIASAQVGVAYSIVSRADSTLRGHYPVELEALGDFDATILAPFFEEGGRYTVDDVQWVRDGEWLVPAAQTTYAFDHTFGYAHSNLRNWVEEKSNGRIRAEAVRSLRLDDLRRGGPDYVERELCLARRHTFILNANNYQDLQTFTLGLLRAEATGRKFLVRSAASFLRVRAGQGSASAPARLAAHQVHITATPGLVLVGSYTPRSTAQLEYLLRHENTTACELSAGAILYGESIREIERVRLWLNAHAASPKHLIVYTSRAESRRAGDDALIAGRRIASALADVVRGLEFRPRFLVVKGGWTASAVGTDALLVKRAYAPTPILPAVPMWIPGSESRFPNMPYVIFPGNVGDEHGLQDVVQKATGLTDH